MKKRKKQQGLIPAIVLAFILAFLLVGTLAEAAAISLYAFSPLRGGQTAGMSAGAGEEGFIPAPGGESWSEVVGGQGSYINGDKSNHFIPCLKQVKSGWCGRTSAQAIIKGYTGKTVSQASLTSGWGSKLASLVPGSWSKRSSYREDNMQSIINTIKGGDAVIIYTLYPKSDGTPTSTGHIMAMTQYDEGRDAFLVHNSRAGACRLQWLSRSFFVSNMYQSKYNESHRGYYWRAP